MVGVLLAASKGRRRPGAAETADLIKGAALIRARAAFRGRPDAGWQDALAVASLLAAPLMVVLLAGQNLGWMATLLWQSMPQASGVQADLWPLAVLLLPLGLALLRLRRVAIVVAAALPLWVIAQAALGQRLQEPRLAAYLVLLVVQLAGFAASPGPRRALGLVTRRSALLALPWAATAAYAGGILPGHYPVPLVIAAAGTGLVALAGLPALASPRGRRVLVLLVIIPGSAFAVSLLSFVQVDYYFMSFAASQFALYGPPVALAALIALTARRQARSDDRRAAMNDETGLERRYRRLLAWYPAQHRHAHGEEMIGVLLASARDGQRRPRRSDALDLAFGGLRIRIRAILAGQFDRSFTDALAVYSIAAPVMWMIFICTWAAVNDYRWLNSATAIPSWQQIAVAVAFPVLLVTVTALPIVLAWRGRPRQLFSLPWCPRPFTRRSRSCRSKIEFCVPRRRLTPAGPPSRRPGRVAGPTARRGAAEQAGVARRVRRGHGMCSPSGALRGLARPHGGNSGNVTAAASHFSRRLAC